MSTFISHCKRHRKKERSQSTTHIQNLVVRRLVPSGVQSSDPGAEIRPRLVPRSLGRDELGDSVVDSVDSLDEVLVELEVKLGDGGIRDGEGEDLGENVETVVPESGQEGRQGEKRQLRVKLRRRRSRRDEGDELVDEPSRAQLGAEPLLEDLSEASLMVIVPTSGVVVDSSNIDDDVTGVD